MEKVGVLLLAVPHPVFTEAGKHTNSMVINNFDHKMNVSCQSDDLK